MSIGVIMLVHTALERAEQVARHWNAAGCPVVIHVDSNVAGSVYDDFVSSLSDVSELKFCKRHRCEWGTWGLVEATQDASELMLASFPDVSHVYLASGACLPLRPVQELRDYLATSPKTDFIESVAVSDIRWTVGGLDKERFTLWFPFSWKKRRYFFDRMVALQRLFGISRRVPNGLFPHMGSQWWCLTRRTLSAILQDPKRKVYEKYFKQVWIPDEAYFQTLARLYSVQIESRSLTLSKFDFQGKPHIFYDDHLQLLQRTDCFVARKIWPQASELYDLFLRQSAEGPDIPEPNPGKINQIFTKAVDRRVRGRPGLMMQSRFPDPYWDSSKTAAPYSVFQGFSNLFENFEEWLRNTTGTEVHGHLFARDKAHFSEGREITNGGLTSAARLRDYNPASFLTSLIWSTRGTRQCFQFGPHDVQDIQKLVAADPNAQISVITGAWAVPLFHSNLDFSEIRSTAARLQSIENKQLKVLRSPEAKAHIRIWTLADFIEAPMEPMREIIDEIGRRNNAARLSEAPKMVDLNGFGKFLQSLRNQGMNPYLMGDFPVSGDLDVGEKQSSKPYLVQ